MGNDYWSNQQLPPYQSATSLKRNRTDFYLPPIGGNFASEILSQNHDLDGSRPIKDTQSIGSAYDNYLRSTQLYSEEGSQYSQMGLGNAAGRVIPAFHLQDHLGIKHLEDVGPELVPNDRGTGFGPPPINRITIPREIIPLPPDASRTLYIEGLPPNSTRREVAHIFRPFVGYKEVRLVRKESKLRGGDPLILCFVDFVDAACAATALSALQGESIAVCTAERGFSLTASTKIPFPLSKGPEEYEEIWSPEEVCWMGSLMMIPFGLAEGRVSGTATERSGAAFPTSFGPSLSSLRKKI